MQLHEIELPVWLKVEAGRLVENELDIRKDAADFFIATSMNSKKMA
jgi:hypothetical protein